MRSILAKNIIWQKILEYKDPIFIFFLTRILTLFVGVYASALIPLSGHARVNDNVFLDIFLKWDYGWYKDIALKGYSINPGSQSNVVFYPLYPFITRIINVIFQNIDLSLLLVANVCFLLALILLYRIVKDRFDDQIAFRACFYLSIFPTSFFFSSSYTESLFLFLLLLCFFFVEKGKWWEAGITGYLLALTRNVGSVMFLAVGFKYLENIKWKLKEIKPNLLWTFLIALGIPTFMLILFLKTGNPLAFLTEQKYYFKELYPPWVAFQRTFDTLTSGNILYGNYDYIRLFISMMVMLFICTFYGIYQRLGLSYLIYALGAFLIPLFSGTLVSMERYVLVLFPSFIIFAIWGKNKYVNYSLTMAFLLFLTIEFVLCANMYWSF